MGAGEPPALPGGLHRRWMRARRPRSQGATPAMDAGEAPAYPVRLLRSQGGATPAMDAGEAPALPGG